MTELLTGRAVRLEYMPDLNLRPRCETLLWDGDLPFAWEPCGDPASYIVTLLCTNPACLLRERDFQCQPCFTDAASGENVCTNCETENSVLAADRI